MAVPASVVAINGGSSSIKFAVYQTGSRLKTSQSGKLDRVGLSATCRRWPALTPRFHAAMPHVATLLPIPQPDVVLACCGDVPTLETLAAVELLRVYCPGLKVRVIDVVNLMKLQPAGRAPPWVADRAQAIH